MDTFYLITVTILLTGFFIANVFVDKVDEDDAYKARFLMTIGLVLFSCFLTYLITQMK